MYFVGPFPFSKDLNVECRYTVRHWSADQETRKMFAVVCVVNKDGSYDRNQEAVVPIPDEIYQQFLQFEGALYQAVQGAGTLQFRDLVLPVGEAKIEMNDKRATVE